MAASTYEYLVPILLDQTVVMLRGVSNQTILTITLVSNFIFIFEFVQIYFTVVQCSVHKNKQH